MNLRVKSDWSILLCALFTVACSGLPALSVDMSLADGGRGSSCTGCAADEVCADGSCQKIPDKCPCPKQTYCDLGTNTCKRGCTDDTSCSTGTCCDVDARSCSIDCKNGHACSGISAPGPTYKLVTDSIQLPKSSGGSSFTMDYDGDGRVENQLKNLVNVLSLSGANVQDSITAGIQAGAGLLLFSVTTANPVSSTCVGVEATGVKPYTPAMRLPVFDGSDVFTPATTAPAPLRGQLKSATLGTTLPAMLAAADEQRLQLQLGFGKTTLNLPLRGVHVEGVLNKVGSVWRIQNGVVHGVISKKDLDQTLLPGLAAGFTQQINSAPTSDTAKALIGLLETKTGPSATKCMVAADCCRLSPATCVILPAEIAASPIGGVIAPDVQVLDPSDRWVPVPGGKAYNAMSFGFGFTAVTASY